MGHYLFGQLVGIGIGVVIGAFMPAIGRKIKALFVKDTQYVESKAKSGLADLTKHL
jgi:hypothetical protein